MLEKQLAGESQNSGQSSHFPTLLWHHCPWFLTSVLGNRPCEILCTKKLESPSVHHICWQRPPHSWMTTPTNEKNGYSLQNATSIQVVQSLQSSCYRMSPGPSSLAWMNSDSSPRFCLWEPQFIARPTYHVKFQYSGLTWPEIYNWRWSLWVKTSVFCLAQRLEFFRPIHLLARQMTFRLPPWGTG